MRCADVERLVTAFVDGDLDERRSSAVRGHGRGCAVCGDLLAAEAAIRDVAAGVAVPDPPEAMWAGIQARLVQEEALDARRSRLWLWWQGGRRHLLTGAVVAAAAGLLVTWHQVSGERSANRTQLASVVPTAAGAPSETFAQRRGAEIVRAEQRYQSAVVELMVAVDQERPTWSSERAARVDARIAALEQEVRRQRAELPGGPGLRELDGLHQAYRVQISFLQDVALGQEIP